MGLKLHRKQGIIWKENRKHIRNLLFCGGIQCGKTTLGAAFTRKIAHRCTADETIIIAAPTYKTLQQATIPKFLSINAGLGQYKQGKDEFVYNWGTTVYLRTATHPESMEGIPNCRFGWLDEGGLVSRYFQENLSGRLARLEAPMLVTSTPYAMNWLAEMAHETLEGKRDDTVLVQLRSIDSPYFPEAEFERQRKLLDPRRFAMKYMGQFGKMQGLVFPDLPMIKSTTLPPGTKYYGGLDWGHTDPFVLVVRAVTPEGIHYRVDEFYKVGLIASDMFNVVKSRHQIYKFEQLWADPSRPEYILELEKEGIPVYPGNNDIRLGIDRQTELIRMGRWFMFEDMCPNGKDEYNTYHYPEPKEFAFDQDQKEQNPVDASNHGCLVGSTLVQTPAGPRRINTIGAGDLVNTPFGTCVVRSSGITGIRQVITRGTITGTPEHPVLTKRGWVRLDALMPIDIVLAWNTDGLKGRSIDGTGAIGRLLARCETAASDYTLRFGSVIGGLFRRGITSITKTRISTTTRFPISNACQNQNTSSTTDKISSQGGSLSNENCSLELDPLLQNGTVAPMVWHGIADMLRRVLRIGSRKISSAIIAMLRIRPGGSRAGFARMLVRALIGENWVSITSLASVKSAVDQSLIRDINQSPSTEAVLVYNLTVDHGMFFANGILVSNCDADRYVTMGILEDIGSGVKLAPVLPSHSATLSTDPRVRIEQLKKKRANTAY